MKFRVKRISAPLFGVVDSPDKNLWLNAFSRPEALQTVSIEDAAIDLLSEELGLDGPVLRYAAKNYVEGLYRPKSEGLGGSLLGDLGEAITFLCSLADNKEITRVISWVPGAAQTVKGERFPQPDFLVRTSPSDHYALEVKSTEAFDYRKLVESRKRWEYLQPCRKVGDLRARALPQLGFFRGQLSPKQHSLKTIKGEVLAFPVNAGEAAVVLANDGRIAQLSSVKRYKTPQPCRQLGRHCWDCQNDSHFTIVSMHNEPGKLMLGGSAPDGGDGWFHAYKRWAQAVQATEAESVRTATSELVKSLEPWFAQRQESRESSTLRAFWGSYLQDATFARGMRVDVPDSVSRLGSGFGWAEAEMEFPEVRIATPVELQSLLRRPTSQREPFIINLNDEAQGTDRFVVKSFNDGDIQIQMLSHSWVERKAVESRETAERIAGRLLYFVQTRKVPPAGFDGRLPMRRASSAVGDVQVNLGWVPEVDRRDEWWRFWINHGERADFFWPDHPWDRFWSSLCVSNDGRGTVRLSLDQMSG